MQDILERLHNSQPNEGSHDLACRCIDAAQEIERLNKRISDAPAAIMDTRDVLGICAPAIVDFQALYALRGRRVRLVLDEVPNA